MARAVHVSGVSHLPESARYVPRPGVDTPNHTHTLDPVSPTVPLWEPPMCQPADDDRADISPKAALRIERIWEALDAVPDGSIFAAGDIWLGIGDASYHQVCRELRIAARYGHVIHLGRARDRQGGPNLFTPAVR